MGTYLSYTTFFEGSWWPQRWRFELSHSRKVCRKPWSSTTRHDDLSQQKSPKIGVSKQTASISNIANQLQEFTTISGIFFADQHLRQELQPVRATLHDDRQAAHRGTSFVDGYRVCRQMWIPIYRYSHLQIPIYIYIFIDSHLYIFMEPSRN